ncbi:MAG: hypothetical protein ACRCSN_19910 [Dermatophilaceae bacterium]
MRTTLSLDDDVAAHLERLRSQRDLTLRELVNTALRVGLAVVDEGTAPRPGPYTVSRSLGRPRLPDVDDVSEALAVLEEDDRR